MPKNKISNKISFWHYIANPHFFMRITNKIMPWLSCLVVILFLLGFYLIANSPDDYQQGITVRIIYLHVPFAWLSMFCYCVMSAAAFGTLIWRHSLAAIALKSAAPIGACFTALALITGSLWGRPTWGTWWEWDARLTSVLILFFIYLAIIALGSAFDDKQKAAKACAILTLIGFINIPIIKFSVDWWNTLHQPASIFRKGGPAIDQAILIPLLVMALAFSLLFILLHLISMQTEIRQKQIHALQRKYAQKRMMKQKNWKMRDE